MREVVGKLKGSLNRSRARKAVADHIATLAMGTTEAGSSVPKVNASTFQRFAARNGTVLKEAGFTEVQVSNM
jgi:hypothetical protein